MFDAVTRPDILPPGPAGDWYRAGMHAYRRARFEYGPGVAAPNPAAIRLHALTEGCTNPARFPNRSAWEAAGYVHAWIVDGRPT